MLCHVSALERERERERERGKGENGFKRTNVLLRCQQKVKAKSFLSSSSSFSAPPLSLLVSSSSGHDKEFEKNPKLLHNETPSQFNYSFWASSSPHLP